MIDSPLNCMSVYASKTPPEIVPNGHIIIPLLAFDIDIGGIPPEPISNKFTFVIFLSFIFKLEPVPVNDNLLVVRDAILEVFVDT